jgi:hypothetical protein
VRCCSSPCRAACSTVASNSGFLGIGSTEHIPDAGLDGGRPATVPEAPEGRVPSREANAAVAGQGHLTRRLFGAMTRRIEALPVPAGGRSAREGQYL